jgi:hypothetical protein
MSHQNDQQNDDRDDDANGNIARAVAGRLLVDLWCFANLFKGLILARDSRYPGMTSLFPILASGLGTANVSTSRPRSGNNPKCLHREGKNVEAGTFREPR